MRSLGYAAVSLDAADWQVATDGVERAGLTEPLGCTDTAVAAHRVRSGSASRLAPDREQVCIAIDGPVHLVTDDAVAVPATGVGCVPAGVDAAIETNGTATVVVVASAPDPRPEAAVRVVDVETSEFAVPSTSDVATAHLTAPLDCRGVKLNARVLAAGQVVPYHTEGEQEELFVPLRGPASMAIDGESVPTPPGTVARVAPPVPRSARNDGTEQALWVMIGAPPTGGPTDWDPGAEIVE